MKQLQANSDSIFFGCGLDYSDLIESFEHEVLCEAHEHDYQGDSIYLLRDGNRIGYLRYGWGSCSGCDALQACDSVKDLTELRDRLYSDIEWFDSLQVAKENIEKQDWETSYLDKDMVAEFLERLKNL